jgi:hypothetical protein
MKPTHQIDYIGIVDDKSMIGMLFLTLYIFSMILIVKNNQQCPALLYFQAHTSKIKKKIKWTSRESNPRPPASL